MPRLCWACDGVCGRRSIDCSHFIEMWAARASCKMVFQQVVIAVDFCHQKVQLPPQCIFEEGAILRPFWCCPLRVCAEIVGMQGFACQDIKLENVLIVNDARTLVKLCISRCSQVRI